MHVSQHRRGWVFAIDYYRNRFMQEWNLYLYVLYVFVGIYVYILYFTSAGFFFSMNSAGFVVDC
jgi:hypothetical protein